MSFVKASAVSLLTPFFFLWLFYGWFRSEYVTDPFSFALVSLVPVVAFDFALRTAASMDLAGAGGVSDGGGECPAAQPFPRLLAMVAATAAGAGLIVYVVGFALGKPLPSAWAPVLAVLTTAVLGVLFAVVGILLHAVTRDPLTEQAVTLPALTLALPMLSGAYLDVRFLPEVLHWVAYLNPLTHAVTLFRAVSLGLWDAPLAQQLGMGIALDTGHGIITPTVSLLVLTGFAVVVTALTAVVLRLRRKA